MVLTVHHLQRGQSERIIWLCEELGLEYDLQTYKRDRKTLAAPPELANLHPTGAAPVIQDGAITLAESGAIAEYILTKYGKGRLVVAPDEADYADYLYYFHFSNSYLQPTLARVGIVKAAGLAPTNPSAVFALRNFDRGMKILDDRLKANKWLAGDETFTAADIMMVWCVTTCRMFMPFSLKGYDGILRWLRDVGERPAYKRAMEKGDPGLEPLLGEAEPERIRPEKL